MFSARTSRKYSTRQGRGLLTSARALCLSVLRDHPCAAIHLLRVPTSVQKSGEAEQPDVTLLLKRMGQGDREAGDQAIELVYTELHRIASREMRREQPGHTLQTTALVNEAYLRLVGGAPLEIQNRGHFFAIASQQMRRILVDHARSAMAQRRGGGAVRVELEKVGIGVEEQSLEDLLGLDEALTELERIEPRAAQIVVLRYFGGHTDKELVDMLGLSLATVRRDWEFARAWLFDRMKGQSRDPSTEGRE